MARKQEILTKKQLEELFDEYIDEVTPEVSILGCVYDPSEVLKSTDPVGYANQLDLWISEQQAEGIFGEKKVGTTTYVTRK